MAGKSSRDKGARGEREVIALLQPVVDRVCDACGQIKFVLRRNYAQRFEAKLYDVEGLPWMAIEVKRVENTAGLPAWWRQTLASARPGQTPVLFWRQNNGPWKVRTRVVIAVGKWKIRSTVDMRMKDWMVWFEKALETHLRGRSR